ncbi:hypothetical protein H0H81_008310 [Sphagnurus paluster]|uniref:Queuosine 5'-phosphate N-glycosylase/hydrolase n=1 Tax=Sphagnurus paluster TaxID=117069 RepID=A0A9P7FQ00_9AGAR|nr:hypothetical protein H0H81_008310 [Sphagnurus paluster]
MHELVGLITSALNETGDILVNLGYPNLGAFVAEALEAGAKVKSGAETSQVDVVLERLVCAIPAFQDMAVVDNQPIYCFKKALFLIHAIVIRFGSMSPPPFPTPSTAQSPVFTDNVLPSMLIHLGVIDLSTSPGLSHLFPHADPSGLLEAFNGNQNSQNVPKEGPILTSDQAYILRAAAIDACEMIVEVAHNLSGDSLPPDGSLDWLKDINLPDLDMWIWAVAKDRQDYRQLERFALRNTVFF